MFTIFLDWNESFQIHILQNETKIIYVSSESVCLKRKNIATILYYFCPKEKIDVRKM